MDTDHFDRFIERVKAGYEGQKRQTFENAVTFLKAHAVKETDLILEAEQGHFSFLVDYLAARSLKITDKSSGRTISGFVRDLHLLLLQLQNPETPNNWCSGCSRKHYKYGIELEVNINLPGEDRYAFLRKCNEKAVVFPDKDSIGIDGSQGPLEIRNVNGDSPKEVCDRLSQSWHKLLDVYDWWSKNFPGVAKSTNFHKCGIHVHFWHPNEMRDRVVVAHTFLGTLVNSFDLGAWRSRLSSGYGGFGAMRSVSDWCHGNCATELRMLNVVPVSVLRLTLEYQEEILQNKYDVSMSRLQNEMEITRLKPCDVLLDKLIAFLLVNKLSTFLRMRRFIKEVNKIYRQRNEAFKFEVDLKSILVHVRHYRKKEKPLAKEKIVAEVKKRENRSWCQRLQESVRTRGTQATSDIVYFRDNCASHVRSCGSCTEMISEQNAQGYSFLIVHQDDRWNYGFVQRTAQNV